MADLHGSIRGVVLLTVLLVVTGSVSGCDSGDSQPVDRLAPVDSTGVVALIVPQSVCEDCLHLTRLAILGDTAGAGYVNVTQNVVRDSLGRYWLNQEDRLKVFDGDGRYVGEVGRPGEGPMEFSRPVPVYTDAAGNVHVFDPRNVRETVISPRFERVRATRLPGAAANAHDVVPLPEGGRYVVNRLWIAPAARLGLPLHVISGDSLLVSFGADSAPNEPQLEFESLRILATDDAGRIFSTRRFAYDIDVWSSTGRRIVEFRGPELNAQEVKWGRPLDFDDNPLANEIRDLQAGAAGRLWILSWRAEPNWQRHYVRRPRPGGSTGLQLREGSTADSLYSSRIDVIDLHRGALVARLDHPGLLTGFAGRGLVFQNVFLQDGTPQIVIWQATLNEPEA